jgi:outer membrane scaffolding protein for murein synthesis (MipA/OmpV family)
VTDVGQPGALPAAPDVQRQDAAAAAGGSAAARSAASRGRERPVWEAGLGATALSLPDYRGSEKSRGYLLPLPYLVYRGPRFSVDRGGLKAELLDKGRLELDFSVNLSVPVRSDGNRARQGMPSLRPALEIGPQLLADLWNSSDGRTRLQLQLPLRYAFALSTDTRDAGFVFHPRLGLDVRDFGGYRGLNAGLVVGPMFATARQHDYFYTVDPQYATATRPAYQAGGGYSGMQLTMSLSKRYPKYWFGAFVRADWLKGATFRDSPLVTRETTVAAGFAISWIFAESADRIVTRD